MRLVDLTAVAGIRLLVLFAFVLAACGGQNQPEPTSGSQDQSTQTTGTVSSQLERIYNSGSAHFEEGEYELAIDDFDEAIRLDPTFALAYSTKGFTLIFLRRFQLAVDELDDAIRLDPQAEGAYRNRGLAYVGLGQEQRGIEDYDTAVRLEPRFALAYADRAIAYARIIDDAAAQRDVELAVQFGVNRAALESALEEIRSQR